MSYAILIMVVLFVDQLSKAVAYALQLENIVILPKVLILDFLPEPNDGMAFGWLGGKAWAMPMFIAITSVAMVVFLILLIRTRPNRKFLRVALALILCGALGNFIDRVVLGEVRDFIALSVGNIPFLNFNCNVADIAITVGAVMLILDLLFIDEDAIFRFGKKKKERQKLDNAATALDKTDNNTEENDG